MNMYLSASSYLIWMFEIESFKFPIIVLISDPNHDLFFQSRQQRKFKTRSRIECQEEDIECQGQNIKQMLTLAAFGLQERLALVNNKHTISNFTCSDFSKSFLSISYYTREKKVNHLHNPNRACNIYIITISHLTRTRLFLAS